MRTFTYWASANQNDSATYSIRRKTRKAVKAELADQGMIADGDGYYGDGAFGKIEKVTLQYVDLMDLVNEAVANR